MTRQIIEALESLGGSGDIDDLYEKTGTEKFTLRDNLRTMIKRGDIERTYTKIGKYRGSTIGLMTKYTFIYSLK